MAFGGGGMAFLYGPLPMLYRSGGGHAPLVPSPAICYIFISVCVCVCPAYASQNLHVV